MELTSDVTPLKNSYLVIPDEVVVHVNMISSLSVGLLTSAVNTGVAGLSGDQGRDTSLSDLEQ